MIDWLEIAKKEIGINERENKDRIHEYFEETRQDDFWWDNIANGIPAWCAVFINYCLKKSYLPGTGSPAAIDFLKWGDKLNEPQVGCVAVLYRLNPLSWESHVGFVTEISFTKIKLLGGNQGDAVCEKWYYRGRVRRAGYRWPKQTIAVFVPPRKDIFRGGYEQILAAT